MKKNVFVVLLLFIVAFTHAQDSIEKRNIQLLPSSNLTIIGDSNIAKFQCEFATTYLEKSQDIQYSETGSQIKFSKAILTLNNKGFDCGSRGINRDFHDLLKSSDHPKILLELNKIDLTEDNTKGIASIKITIAGKTNNYKVPVSIKNGIISEFKGILKLDIKDFGLEPPKKLFGMIVVKDDIEINFDLFIKK